MLKFVNIVWLDALFSDFLSTDGALYCEPCHNVIFAQGGANHG